MKSVIKFSIVSENGTYSLLYGLNVIKTTKSRQIAADWLDRFDVFGMIFK